MWNSDCQRLSAKLEEIQDEGVNCELKAGSKEKKLLKGGGDIYL